MNRDARGRFVVSPESLRGKLATEIAHLREQNAAWEEQWIRAVAERDEALALKESAAALAAAQDRRNCLSWPFVLTWTALASVVFVFGVLAGLWFAR